MTVTIAHGIIPTHYGNYGHFKHYFRLEGNDFDGETRQDLFEFCRDQFGICCSLEDVDVIDPIILPLFRWGFLGDRFFYFQHDADAMMFKLSSHVRMRKE